MRNYTKIREFKPVLFDMGKRIGSLKIFDRLKTVLGVIALIIVIALYLVWTLIVIFFTVLMWVVVNVLNIGLIIPMFIYWILTGKDYIWRVEDYVNEKTGIFNDFYDK